MKTIALLLLALCIATLGFSQANKVDSLQKLLNNKLADTVQVKVLNDLSYETVETDTAAAHQYANKALAKAQAINYYGGMVDAYYNIAYVYSLLYQKAVAESYYQKGIALATQHKLNKALASGYQDYAILLKSQGKFKPSLEKNLQAVKIYEALRDTGHLALVYTNTGNSYSNLNLSDQAITYHIKSLKINQLRGNNSGIARAYNNIAIVYERNGNFEKALENFLRMLKPALASGKKALIAAAYGNIGSAYENLKQPGKALPYIKTAIEQEEALGNKARVGMNLNNIAAVYNDLHQYQNALAASIRCMQVAREAEDTESLAYAYLTAGTAQAGLKNYKAAQVYMDTAYVKAKAENRSGLLLSFYQQAAQLYKTTGNFKKANELTESLMTLKDSTYNSEKHAQIAALQEQYDSERKDKLITESELASANNKIQIANKNRLLIILGVALTSALFIVGLIIRNMKLQRFKLETEKALAASSAEQELLNEKLRISSELHDNIGSQLTFIHSSIQNLRRAPANGTPQVLQETEDLAVNTIRDLRQTVWFINNSSFSVDDFTIRLREYVKPYQSSHASVLQINNQAPGNIKLSAATATHLFRIVQEAINNSIKYSAASNINIDIMQNAGGSLVVCVNDNGRGFDAEVQDAGFGLRNMRARAQQTGGYMEVRTAINKGTSIEVSVPV